MWDKKKLFPNLDFYAATAYHQCGIPTDFFTPIFVIARTSGMWSLAAMQWFLFTEPDLRWLHSSGWAAHIIEQRAGNKLYRPLAVYKGPQPRPFVPLKDRKPERAPSKL